MLLVPNAEFSSSTSTHRVSSIYITDQSYNIGSTLVRFSVKFFSRQSTESSEFNTPSWVSRVERLIHITRCLKAELVDDEITLTTVLYCRVPYHPEDTQWSGRLRSIPWRGCNMSNMLE